MTSALPTKRFDLYYKEEVNPAIAKELNYKSPLQVPRLEKIVLSAGVGESIRNRKLLGIVQNEMSIIAQQHAVQVKARMSVANFKLREGMPIGVKVTLRRAKMYDFYYRLIHIAIPRIKDFRGMNTRSFDGKGNYSFGIKEHIIFPEIDYDKIEQINGLNVTLVTSSHTDREAKLLLEKMHFPFKKEGQ